jgi:hypothetical protein
MSPVKDSESDCWRTSSADRLIVRALRLLHGLVEVAGVRVARAGNVVAGTQGLLALLFHSTAEVRILLARRLGVYAAADVYLDCPADCSLTGCPRSRQNFASPIARCRTARTSPRDACHTPGEISPGTGFMLALRALHFCRPSGVDGLR